MVLQQLHDVTDEQTLEALAFHLTWHSALDIRHPADAYICERTLRLFRSLTDQLIQVFDVDPHQQRLDSTAIRSAMRSLTRLGILVETVSKFLRELKRTCHPLYAKVSDEVIRTYLQRQAEGCFAEKNPDRNPARPPLPDLITHIAVGKMTVHDQSALEPALDDVAQRKVKPEVLLTDTHYGDDECLAQGKERDVEIVSLAMPAKGKQQSGRCRVRRSSGRRR